MTDTCIDKINGLVRKGVKSRVKFQYLYNVKVRGLNIWSCKDRDSHWKNLFNFFWSLYASNNFLIPYLCIINGARKANHTNLVDVLIIHAMTAGEMGRGNWLYLYIVKMGNFIWVLMPFEMNETESQWGSETKSHDLVSLPHCGMYVEGLCPFIDKGSNHGCPQEFIGPYTKVTVAWAAGGGGYQITI